MKQLVLILGIITLSACSSARDINQESSKENLMEKGSLVIARPLPAARQTSGSLFGFMPQKQQTQSASLVIDSSSGKAELRKGALKLADLPLLEIEGLNPGSYTVVHKQRHPIWYANDEYFANRGLEIPSKNARDRYLKGALGDFVIYLNEETPIHNASVFSKDVGGIRLPDNHIAQVYYQLEVGAQVEIK